MARAANLRLEGRPAPAELAAFWRQALVFSVLALMSLGLIMAASIEGPRLGYVPALAARASRMMVGMAAFYAAYRLRLDRAREVLLPFWVTGVFLCLVPRILGDDTNGAYRWINLGPLSFQPVELLKILSVLATAEMLERRRTLLDRLVTGLLPVVTIPVVSAAALVVQPDIGHAFFVLATCGILILCGGARARHSLLLIGLAVLALWLILGGFAHSRSRVGEFASGQPGYQLSRSLLAFAEGGVTGLGVGNGWIKLGFLPEARNDFVLSIVGNELGVPGSVAVVGLFALLFTAGMQIAGRAATRFELIVALGLSLILVVQACVNVLGVTFSVPEKGIDLPFLSSGGTNLVFALGSVGILVRIAEAGASAGRAEAP